MRTPCTTQLHKGYNCTAFTVYSPEGGGGGKGVSCVQYPWWVCVCVKGLGFNAAAGVVVVSSSWERENCRWCGSSCRWCGSCRWVWLLLSAVSSTGGVTPVGGVAPSVCSPLLSPILSPSRSQTRPLRRLCSYTNRLYCTPSLRVCLDGRPSVQ